MRAAHIPIIVAVVVLALTAWQQPWRSAGVANGSHVFAGQPTPTTFAVPVSVSWAGVITRTLAGSRGLEVHSAQAPGDYFFVYWDDDRVSAITEGAVSVQGDWMGNSCEYGRCAPEISATDVTSIAP